jgi:hypothetical protein
MRVLRSAALVMLLSALCIGPAAAQQSVRSVTLMAGDPQRCADFAELMEHPVIGRYEYYWGITGRNDDSWDSHYRTVAAAFIKSPGSRLFIRFEFATIPGQYRYGKTLAFALGGREWAPSDGVSGPRAIAECGSTQKLPFAACVLDDNRVAAVYGLPDLDADEIARQHGITSVYGNSYYFYHFKQRYWLLIAPFRPKRPKRLLFGFALHDADSIVEGRVKSLFEFGCQLEEKGRVTP